MYAIFKTSHVALSQQQMSLLVSIPGWHVCRDVLYRKRHQCQANRTRQLYKSQYTIKWLFRKYIGPWTEG